MVKRGLLASQKSGSKQHVMLILYGLLLSSAACLLGSTATFAVSPFIKENAYVYNPESVDSCIGIRSSSSAAISGNTNPEKIFNYLTGRGLSPEAAGGVLGNIAIESGQTFSPFIQEYAATWPKGGYGLVQWTADRRRTIETALEKDLPEFFKYYDVKYSKADVNTGLSKGLSGEEGQRVNDALLQFQLDYLYQESTTRRVRKGYGPAGATEWEVLMKAKTVRDASDLWLYSFERPRDQGLQQAVGRAKLGQSWLDKVRGSGTATPTTPTDAAQSITDSGCAVEQTGTYTGSMQDLQQLTLLYAHPNYHRKPFVKKMPAYDQAIEKAKKSGNYIGDPCSGGGVDCGAFTTRLIIDSGWDPDFNFKGKGGNTSVQEEWMKQNWEIVGRRKVDTSLLRPGDVAIEPGHTFIFVGNIPGFDKQVASASQCGRAPMAGSELDMSASGFKGYTWYRKKGTSA